jgi:hypothetical protein
VRQQLLGDVAALLTGLRCAVMLDYAPGATPQQLAQALAPLQQALPGWTGEEGGEVNTEGDPAMLCCAEPSEKRGSGQCEEGTDHTRLRAYSVSGVTQEEK